MQTQINTSTLEERNNAVMSAFLNIMKSTKELLSGLPQDLLRHTLELKDNVFLQPKILEFITPLCYLCLIDSEQGYQIRFGFDQSIEFTGLTSVFIRMVYKATMDNVTPVSIEDCIAAHTIITDTSGLFDYTHWKHQDWPVIVLKYKPTKQKKQRKAVA